MGFILSVDFRFLVLLGGARAAFEVLTLSSLISLLIHLVVVLRVPQLGAPLGQLTKSVFKSPNIFTDLGHPLEELGQLLKYLL